MNRNQQWMPGAIAGVCATFMGTVVGAGFASGREIYQFFGVYGGFGFAGIVLAFLLMGLAGVKVYRYGYTKKPQSYRDILQFLLGPRPAVIADCFLSLFFLILIAIMFAGSGAVFTTLHLSRWYGILITAVLLIGVLWNEFTGLIAINLLVIPLMFFGALLVSGNAIVSHPELIRQQTAIIHNQWGHNPRQLAAALLAAGQFSAYNLILAVPVLLALAKRYPNPKVLRTGGWLGCLGLGLMTAFMQGALLTHCSISAGCPLPMVELAKKLGKWGSLGYAVILWGEMLTTLIANTYGLGIRLAALTRSPFRLWVIVLTGVGILLAQIGFTELIAGVYPVYGLLCIVLILLLFVKVKEPAVNDSVWKWN